MFDAVSFGLSEPSKRPTLSGQSIALVLEPICLNLQTVKPDFERTSLRRSRSPSLGNNHHVYHIISLIQYFFLIKNSTSNLYQINYQLQITVSARRDRHQIGSRSTSQLSESQSSTSSSRRALTCTVVGTVIQSSRLKSGVPLCEPGSSRV